MNITLSLQHQLLELITRREEEMQCVLYRDCAQMPTPVSLCLSLGRQLQHKKGVLLVNDTSERAFDIPVIGCKTYMAEVRVVCSDIRTDAALEARSTRLSIPYMVLKVNIYSQEGSMYRHMYG